MKGQAALYTAAGIGCTLICLLGVNWIGPVGAFLNLLTPIFAAYIGLRFGVRSALVVVIVTCLLIVQLASVYTLTAYLGMFGAGSVLLPFLLRRKMDWDRSAALAVVGAAVLTAVMISAAALTTGVEVSGLIDQAIQAEVDQAMQIYRNSGLNEAQLQEMQKVTDGLAEFIAGSFYGLFLAAVIAVQALCLLLLYALKNKYYQIPGVSFHEWRLPARLIWVLIVSGFSLLVPISFIEQTGYNVLVVLLPLYFFQGMAVVNSFLKRKAYPPLVKGLIYTLLLILNPLPIVVTSVGVFDLWIDFRRPRDKQI